MTISDKELKFTNVILEQIQSALGVSLTKEQLMTVKLTSWHDEILDRFFVQARWITAGRTQTYEHPADWWQFFKQRWFPKWALKRWPVVMKVIRAYELFPDLPVRVNSSVQQYLQVEGIRTDEY